MSALCLHVLGLSAVFDNMDHDLLLRIERQFDSRRSTIAVWRHSFMTSYTGLTFQTESLTILTWIYIPMSERSRSSVSRRLLLACLWYCWSALSAVSQSSSSHTTTPAPFLTRVSTLTRDIDIAMPILSVRLDVRPSVRPSVRLSVCLSVTRWYCMKTA